MTLQRQHRKKNAEGLTWPEWVRAVGVIFIGQGVECIYDGRKLRTAWRHGEDPSEWRVFVQKRAEARAEKARLAEEKRLALDTITRLESEEQAVVRRSMKVVQEVEAWKLLRAKEARS